MILHTSHIILDYILHLKRTTHFKKLLQQLYSSRNPIQFAILNAILIVRLQSCKLFEFVCTPHHILSFNSVNTLDRIPVYFINLTIHGDDPYSRRGSKSRPPVRCSMIIRLPYFSIYIKKNICFVRKVEKTHTMYFYQFPPITAQIVV